MAVNNQHARSGRLLKEDDRHINIGDYLQENTTFFGERKVATKRSQLTYNSDLPLSNRRDVQTVEGNATIVKDGPEYRLRATSTTDDRATLRSAQRGSYQSGSVFEPGQGLRTSGTPTGTAYFKIGYYDGSDGINLIYDADGYALLVTNDGVETRVDQADWNMDTLDGSRDRNNPSGYNFDSSSGAVLQTPFIYYGYGPILLQLKVSDEFGIERMVTCHCYNNVGATTINEPNLPLSAEVFSGDSGSQLDLYIGGRQMSFWGTADQIERTTFARRTVSGVGATNWVPMISFREKASFSQVPIQLSGLVLIPTGNIEFEIHRESVLTGASFTYLGNMIQDEIATEWDVSAGTTYTPGDAVYGGLASGGGQTVASSQQLPNRPIYEEDTYTLAVRSLSGNVSVSGTLRATEDW